MCFSISLSPIPRYIAIIESTTLERLVDYLDDVESELRRTRFIPGRVLLDLKVCNGEDSPNRYHVINYDGFNLLDRSMRPLTPSSYGSL
jgi:hypothetical protein